MYLRLAQYFCSRGWVRSVFVFQSRTIRILSRRVGDAVVTAHGTDLYHNTIRHSDGCTPAPLLDLGVILNGRARTGDRSWSRRPSNAPPSGMGCPMRATPGLATSRSFVNADWRTPRKWPDDRFRDRLVARDQFERPSRRPHGEFRRVQSTRRSSPSSGMPTKSGTDIFRYFRSCR